MVTVGIPNGYCDECDECDPTIKKKKSLLTE